MRGRGEAHPATDHGFYDATSDPDQIRKWWRGNPDANIGICTGDGFFVFDVDDLESFGRFLEEHGPLPETLTVRTGGGGLHFYFGVAHPVGSLLGKIWPGIDIKGDGAYVVGPPSLHESGEQYSVEVDAPVAPAPEPLLRLIEQARRRPASKLAPSSIPEGQRNTTLFREACKLRRQGLTFEEALPAIGEVNRARCDPPLPDHEVEAAVRSACSYQPDTHERLTDVGNARRLARLAKGRLLYVKRLGGWLIYEGGRWIRDELNVAQELAKEIPRELYAEASATDDDQRRKALSAWARKSEARAYIASMLRLAESVPELVASVAEFDRNPWLLNVRNGVLDLQTGELRPHDSRDRLTKLAPVEWLGLKAKAPQWDDHLNYIMDGDHEVVAFLHRAWGYSLTGDTREQKLFIAHGRGANGKSVTLEVLRGVLGDYATQTPAETLMVKRHGGASNDIARLRGARMVTAVEAEASARLAEVLVKQITGGDTVSARFLYKEFFEFQPEFKIWLAVNQKPTIYGTDHAIWRRIIFIPFEVTIPEERRVKGIASKLRKEASGILARLVRGCLEWQKSGLAEPEVLKIATARYREEEDRLAGFLAARCDVGKGKFATAADLYETYKSWAEDVGEEPVKWNQFGQMLGERGLRKDRKGPDKGTRWHGLGLKRRGPKDDPDF